MNKALITLKSNIIKGGKNNMIPTTIFEVIDNSKSVEVKAQTTLNHCF